MTYDQEELSGEELLFSLTFSRVASIGCFMLLAVSSCLRRFIRIHLSNEDAVVPPVDIFAEHSLLCFLIF